MNYRIFWVYFFGINLLLLCSPLFSKTKTLSLHAHPDIKFSVEMGTAIDLPVIPDALPQEILDTIISQGIVIVDCYATWCTPCKVMARSLSLVAPAFPDLVIIKINVEDYPSLAQRYNVRGLPTLLFFKDGKKAKHLVGALDQNRLKAEIQQLYKG